MPFTNTLIWRALALLATLLMLPQASAADNLIDRVSLEAGSGTSVVMVRLGVQRNFTSRWFVSNGTHLGGYWDASLAQWRGNKYRNIRGQHQNITNIGLTPVFRLQADNLRGWYAEGGIGVNWLSDHYDNSSNQLSTKFQFGDHIGTGYVFDNGWDVGVKLQHFSNGGIKRPNSGVNFVLIKAARSF